MQNIDDSSSQIGSCLVSRTKRLVRSVRRNLNAFLNLYFMTCLPIELTGTGLNILIFQIYGPNIKNTQYLNIYIAMLGL